MVSKVKNIKKRFKSTSLFRFIMVMRLFLGGYYQATNSKLLSFFIKLYCIVFTIILCVIYVKVYPLYSPFGFVFLKLGVHTFISMFTAEKYLFKYCDFIRTADAIMGIKNSTIMTKESLVVVIYIITSRLSLSTYWIVNFIRINVNLTNFISITFALFSTDIYYLTVVIVFALLFNRIKRLRKSLEITSVPVNIIGHNEIAINIKQIRNCVLYYNNLLNNLEHVNFELQILMIFSLLVALPQLLVLTYLSAHLFFSQGATVPRITNQVLDIVQVFVLISSPAVIAEMAISEVQKIKMIIFNLLRRCSDQSLRFELRIALDYVTHRPFAFTILRVIPVDFTLPLGIITLCITYVIVAIQLLNFAS